MGWQRYVAMATAAVVLLGSGYAVADARDLVPGVLTTEPPYPSPAPFPSIAAPQLADVSSGLSTPSATAPVPDATTVQAAADRLMGDPRLGTGSGVLVTDLITGETIAHSSADIARVPASTQKTLTAIAALTSPGPKATLKTSTVLAADHLVLVGGGDMMLAEGAGNPDAVNGRAGLGDLAESTAAALITAGQTAVRLSVDDSLFTGPAIAPGWNPDDVPMGFAAPVAALAVDVGRLGGAGQTLPGDAQIVARAADPALAAARIFGAHLTARGIAVTGDIGRATAPTDAAAIATVESAPLWQIVDFFLEYSDNSITESVGRVVALNSGLPGSFDGAVQAVRTAVGGLGVDLTGAVLTDCSGLSRGQALTPRQLDAAIRALADPGHPALRSGAAGMPIGALTGTLADRYLDTPAAGVVRAKTGSLPGAAGLAGTVMTADGRQLAFTVLTQGIPPGTSRTSAAAFDEFLVTLAGCGCTA